MSSCVCVLPVVRNTHLPVYAVRVSISHRSLNTDPMSCMWIDHFSAGSDSWGVSVSSPGRADSCSFPSPSSPTVEPCAESTSPECQHSCNYLAHITSSVPFFPLFLTAPQSVHSLSFPQRSVCLSVARLHLYFVYVSHRLCFLQECRQVRNFTLLQSDNFAP